MSEDNKSIHEFDFKLICEYFSSIERQGPGSPEVTVKALSFIDNLTNEYYYFVPNYPMPDRKIYGGIKIKFLD